MLQTLRKAGGSLVMTVPKSFIEQNGLSEGSQVELHLHGKKMTVEAPARPRYKLADLMADAWGVSGLPAPDALVPVPLHAQRQRVRGYNQSELLARRLSVQTGFPVWRDVLLRTARTGPQARLGLDERSRNIAGAFE
ncbi:MAG TPA: AbrB/MazE/SpoVT family DNA-binding domain-containing protein, partial [Nitrosomonas europaea]|nr:AbrB/MazE/SpoVT family DNA-binding domain-containing protein [Nitrosomonas europaea]